MNILYCSNFSKNHCFYFIKYGLSIVSLSISSSWLPTLLAFRILFCLGLPDHNESIIFQLFYFFLVEFSGLIRILFALVVILISMELLFGVFAKLVSCSLVIFLLRIGSFDSIEFDVVCWVTVSSCVLLLFKFVHTFESTFFVSFSIFRFLRILIVFRMYDNLWFLPLFSFSSLRIIIFFDHVSTLIPGRLISFIFISFLLFFNLFFVF